MIKVRIIAVSLAACICIACGDGGGGPSAVEDYFPLETGSTWEFEMSGTGSIDTFDIVVSGTLEVVVGDTVQLADSLAAFVVESESVTIFDVEQGSWADTTVDLRTFYWRELDGQISQYDSLSDSTGRIIHSPPIEVGRVWYPGPDEPGGSYEVESVSETVTVPFGTFEDCARIWHNNPDSKSSSYDFHAPGVGIVRIETSIDADSIVLDVDYDLTYTNS